MCWMFRTLDAKFRLWSHIRDDATSYQWECICNKYKQYTQQYKRNETPLGLPISSFCHQVNLKSVINQAVGSAKIFTMLHTVR